MYNEEIKNKFISTVESDTISKIYIGIFRDMEELEEKYNIDLSCIPKDVIAEYIMQFKVRSYTALDSKVKRIARYQKWAIDYNIVPEEYRWIPYERINLQQIFSDNFHMTIFHNPKEICDMLAENFPAKSQMGITTDQISQAYIALLFQGINSNDVLKLTVDNITICNNDVTISINEEIIAVYTEFKTIISNIYNTRVYSCQSYNGRQHGERVMSERFLDNGSNLDDLKMKNRIVHRIRRDLNHLNLRIDDIYIMGKIYASMQAGITNNRDILISCYGPRYTSDNREKIYNLLNVWNKR